VSRLPHADSEQWALKNSCLEALQIPDVRIQPQRDCWLLRLLFLVLRSPEWYGSAYGDAVEGLRTAPVAARNSSIVKVSVSSWAALTDGFSLLGNSAPQTELDRGCVTATGLPPLGDSTKNAALFPDAIDAPGRLVEIIF
jgi:hypothetical protein